MRPVIARISRARVAGIAGAGIPASLSQLGDPLSAPRVSWAIRSFVYRVPLLRRFNSLGTWSHTISGIGPNPKRRNWQFSSRKKRLRQSPSLGRLACLSSYHGHLFYIVPWRRWRRPIVNIICGRAFAQIKGFCFILLFFVQNKALRCPIAMFFTVFVNLPAPRVIRRIDLGAP